MVGLEGCLPIIHQDHSRSRDRRRACRREHRRSDGRWDHPISRSLNPQNVEMSDDLLVAWKLDHPILCRRDARRVG